MAVAPPPSLNEAIQHSREAWQRDLQALFDHAKDRFPDVVWELISEEDSATDQSEQVWGHKAIVYARAPPTFQARYFQFRPAPVASPMPYYSPNGQSVLSLNGEPMSYSPIRSPSPYGTFRTQSPAPSGTGQMLRLQTSIASSLFSNELEYLYTGKGLGEAFGFLFENNDVTNQEDGDEQRVDKLRKDMVFMWRSRLYSDVRLAIEGNFKSSTLSEGEPSSAEFSSHRFMLASRSPYFRTELLGGFAPRSAEPGQPLTLTLPSPPFTPASLHFVIGFIYTGTVAFSNRTFDLDTAFNILRSALYLSLTSLYNEMQARIVQEMMHGLFHAFLDFDEYERVTAGQWGVGGCKCKTCARRTPRILEFALAEDVKNIYLERGARRALVGIYGEGWCTQEFASLPQKMRDFAIKGISKRATTKNLLPMIIAAHRGLEKLDRLQSASAEIWNDVAREAILAGLKHVADSLCTNIVDFFEDLQWLAILEADGAQFTDIEQVEWVTDAIRRGLADKNGGIIYQALVSAVLIRPHSSEQGDTMLSAQSRIRALVERTREDVIRWLRRRWMGVRQEHGFNGLESWALKEISHEIEVPVEDLVVPLTATAQSNGVTRTPVRTKARPRPSGDDSSSIASITRTASRTHTPTPSVRDRLKSSATSVRSVSTTSTASTVSPKAPVPRVVTSPRVDPTGQNTIAGTSSHPRAKTPTSSVRSLRSPSVVTLTKGRTTSTNSKSPAAASKAAVSSQSSLVDAGLSRSASAATNATSTTFKTAKSELSGALAVPRSRRGSTSSNVSVKSSVTSKVVRSRRGSDASMASATSATAPRQLKRTAISKTANTTDLSRPKSVASIRSTTSVRTAKAHAVNSSPPPPVPSKDVRAVSSGATPQSNRTKEKGKDLERSSPMMSLKTKRSAVRTESDGASTVKNVSTEKRASNATITTIVPTIPQNSAPRGAVLNIGIPCIVSSKRTRFRAFARYIGEVEGESGTWVGVEIPVSDSWGNDKLEGRQWNDGSWGGVRYFEIHNSGEWDEAEERAARQRRLDQINAMLASDGSNKGVKREGDQLSTDRAKRIRSTSPSVSDMSVSDTRGLFVRPRQVLYVVDAVGSDI